MENAAAVDTPNDDMDFENAFADDTPTETPAPDALADEEVAEPAATPAEVEEEQPRYAQITEDEYRRLMEAADTVSKLGQLQDKAFGKIGGIERYIQQLQSQTPTGVDISEEDVKDLADEYPELGALQLKVLQKVAGKLKGTGGAPGINPDQVDALVQHRLSEARDTVKSEIRRELAEEALTETHPDWRQVKDSDGFRQWLAAKPAEYQQQAATSMSPAYAAKVIGEYKAALKPAPKSNPQSRSRIEAAVTPKSTGGYTPSASEDDDFVAGFNSA